LPETDVQETLLLDGDAAKVKAEPFGRFDQNGDYDPEKNPKKDPFPTEVKLSLLTADDIKKYVLETGVIAPFYEGGGKKSRMKDASYEGRIGDKAFVYKPDKTEPTQVFHAGDRVLTVPANSIVFVECDLYFRIPDFIALRFNLQIRHVHRGLLLGTGPLIDPGYWGKLCIPLHNLTDENYDIPFDEGLIWIEFTKTTAIRDRIGRPPLGKEYPEILAFLEKASSRFDKPKQKVGIRSSVPKAVAEATVLAGRAEKIAKRTRALVFGIGLLGGLAALAAIIALFQSTLSLSSSFNVKMEENFKELRPTIQRLDNEFSEHIDLLDAAGQSESEAQASISRLSEMVADLNQNIAGLTSQLDEERTARLESERKAQSEKSESDRRIDGLIETVSELCFLQTGDETLDLCSNITVEPVE
jgi:deoxycytidine triphosphate deaminase/uncharacterized membrane-anchored protein YhcB (DUF1043 family)